MKSFNNVKFEINSQTLNMFQLYKNGKEINMKIKIYCD